MGDDERESWCWAHNVTVQYLTLDGKVLLRSPGGRISLMRPTRAEAIDAGMEATKDWIPSA